MSKALTVCRYINTAVGYGSYARADIEPGTEVWTENEHTCQPYTFQPNEYEQMTDEQKRRLDVYGVVYGDGKIAVQSYMLPWIRGEVDEVDHDNAPNNADFINHSCNPNLIFKPCGSLIARWHIKAGEELTYDYRTESIIVAPIQCHCGTSVCRGIIEGEEWRSKELQAIYGQHFTAHILDAIKQEKEN